MLKRVLGASALCLLGAGTVPALAADVTAQQAEAFTATIEGWGGDYFFGSKGGQFSPNDTSFGSAGIDPRARLNLSDSWALQVDGSADKVFGTKDDDDTYSRGVLGGVHLSNYNDSYLWGAFGGYGQVYTNDGQLERLGVVGLEGQIYYDQSTAYLQAGFTDASEANGANMDPFHDAFFVRGVERYYLSEQTRLQAELSAAFGKQDSDDQHMYAIGWGLRADHQVTDNMSVFAGYRGGYYDNGSGLDAGHYAEHLLNVGVTLRLNQQSLFDADRNGPTLDMPWVTHWAAAGENID